MRSWGPFKRWSGKLALTSGTDFELAIYPFLKIIWPQLLLPEPLIGNKKYWDNKRGIDFCVWSDAKRFPCVVQCKGFQVKNLKEKQIIATEKSIKSFLDSEYKADSYLLVHNREGKFTEFNERVKNRLEELKSSGKVKNAELLDRQKFLERVFNHIKEILNKALPNRSITQLSDFQEIFKFGQVYIPLVPVIEEELEFKRFQAATKKSIKQRSQRKISEILLKPSNVRWTLLTGEFGTGKSTAILQGTKLSEKVPIFIPCSHLPNTGINSTNQLLEEVVKFLNISENYDDETQTILNELAGPILAYLLKSPNSPYIIILDGLDENRAFSDYLGLQKLSNQLQDLECPILLSTRLEHLDNMFGHFSTAFSEISLKKGRRNARLFTLTPWRKKEVCQFILLAMEMVQGNQKKKLRKFLELLKNDKYKPLYGDIPFNPLFLQFILADVAENGIRKTDRCEILHLWIEKKIRRDIESAPQRIRPDSLDIEDFINRMFILMEEVAYKMVSKIGENYQLSESIKSNDLNEIANRILQKSGELLLEILLHSVLMPLSTRKGSNLEITFTFRIFHEFFIACYLVRNSLPENNYPENIKLFYQEINSLEIKFFQ